MRSKRVDRNQPQIVACFRKFGFTVAHTHAIGDGFPDIAISRRGKTSLVEIKDGTLAPSARKLTPAESHFHTIWQDKVHIVESIDDVERLAKELP